MSFYKSKIIDEDIESIAGEIKDIAPKLSGKTLLISGGAGFLGKYIVWTIEYLNKNFLKDPCKVIVVDNFISSLKNSLAPDENIKIIPHDISKPIKFEENIDFIIHAASIASPIFYNKYRIETIDAGILGTKNLLEFAKEKNTQSFLFFSSSEVYGNPDPNFIPTREDYLGNVSCIGPRACYDEPKRMGETLCMTYAELFNLPLKILRPFNIFGPGMRLDDGRVVPNFVVAALKGEKIPLHGDGRNTRTFCYISNAIAGFFQILLSNHNLQVFNIGSDEQEIQMKHLAELILGLVGNESAKLHRIEVKEGVYGLKTNPDRRCPDLTKIRMTIGYNPKVNLVSGLKRFISWVREELDSEKNAYGVQIKCRSCGNENLKKILSLGRLPLANNLLSKKDLGNEEEQFPLEINYCDECHLCQLSYVVHPEKMFRNYVYVTSTTDTFKKHFGDMAAELANELHLDKNSLAVDIGSNDGLLLKKFREMGINVIGVEPAENICEIARKDGIDTICDFFGENAIKDITRVKGRADLITANNVFAHISNITLVADNVKKLLKDDGVFVIEVQYILDTLKDLTFDNIYHEHLSYFSILSLTDFFSRQNMEIFKVKHVDTHGGSIRVFIQKKGSTHKIDSSVQEAIEEEKKFGLEKQETYENFAKKVYDARNNLQEFFRKLKAENKIIAGYGAPAKATTLLNFCGINSKNISYIVDDNPLKQGFVVPGVRIPIFDKSQLNSNPPDYLMILAWNFADEIIRKNESYKQNMKFVIPMPELKIV